MTVEDKEAARFREAMSRVPAAVHVVTTDGPGGRHGATATAVSSVTDGPPTLLVCLNLSSTIRARIARNDVLAVNVLGADQEAIARGFARSMRAGPDDRFSLGRWDTMVTGAPTLEEAVATFDGRVTGRQTIGTHEILLVTIEAVRTSNAHTPGLLYHRRDYTAQLASRDKR